MSWEAVILSLLKKQWALISYLWIPVFQFLNFFTNNLPYIPISTIPNNPFNTHKLLSIMYISPVTHNDFFILHINDMAGFLQYSLKILTSQLLRLNLHKTYYQLYIILLYPQYIIHLNLSNILEGLVMIDPVLIGLN